MSRYLTTRISTEQYDPNTNPNLIFHEPIGTEINSGEEDSYSNKVRRLNYVLDELAKTSGISHVFNVHYPDNATKILGDGYSVDPLSKVEIYNLGLGNRTINALKNEGIVTLRDLIGYSEEGLLTLKGLGKGGFRQIKKVLKKKGLELKNNQ